VIELALHDQLDDVPREDKHERHEHREVRGSQSVKNELGCEVGRETRAVGDGEDGGQDADEHGDAGKNQARIVAERTPATRRRTRRRDAHASR